MELFLLASLFGAFMLLATHVADYASESLRETVRRASMPDSEPPSVEVPVFLESADDYDQAA